MFHTIIIAGHVGKDAEMRYTPKGQAVTSFTVAVNENFTDSNGEKAKRTIWYKVTAWGKLAETCNEYIKKGDAVLVEGRINADPVTGSPRIWTAKDGTPHTALEVTASTVRFLSPREKPQEEHEDAQQEEEPQPF